MRKRELLNKYLKIFINFAKYMDITVVIRELVKKYLEKNLTEGKDTTNKLKKEQT